MAPRKASTASPQKRKSTSEPTEATASTKIQASTSARPRTRAFVKESQGLEGEEIEAHSPNENTLIFRTSQPSYTSSSHNAVPNARSSSSASSETIRYDSSQSQLHSSPHVPIRSRSRPPSPSSLSSSTVPLISIIPLSSSVSPSSNAGPSNNFLRSNDVPRWLNEVPATFERADIEETQARDQPRLLNPLGSLHAIFDNVTALKMIWALFATAFLGALTVHLYVDPTWIARTGNGELFPLKPGDQSAWRNGMVMGWSEILGGGVGQNSGQYIIQTVSVTETETKIMTETGYDSEDVYLQSLGKHVQLLWEEQQHHHQGYHYFRTRAGKKPPVNLQEVKDWAQLGLKKYGSGGARRSWWLATTTTTTTTPIVARLGTITATTTSTSTVTVTVTKPVPERVALPPPETIMLRTTTTVTEQRRLLQHRETVTLLDPRLPPPSLGNRYRPHRILEPEGVRQEGWDVESTAIITTTEEQLPVATPEWVGEFITKWGELVDWVEARWFPAPPPS